MNFAAAVQQTTQAVNAAANTDAIYSQIGALPARPASKSIVQAFATAETAGTIVENRPFPGVRVCYETRSRRSTFLDAEDHS